MDVEILTYDADPNHGGFGARVDALVRMFAAFARVRVTLTDWFEGTRVPGVIYEPFPVRDTLGTRLRRLRTYYKTDFPRRDGAPPPDLQVVETLDLWGLRPSAPRTPRILDEHNVYWDLLKYDMSSAPFFSTRLGRTRVVRRFLEPRLWRRAKAYEVRAIREAAGTFVTSLVDREVLAHEIPDRAQQIRVLPNTVDLDHYRDYSGTEAGRSVLFIGNYAYGPNLEAARFIEEQLAPRIPDAQFVLVGKGPTAPERAVSNVAAKGFVPDLNDALGPATVCVAPLTKGSGTRLKILTYLASGKAVVASTKAAEGLEAQDGVHLLLRDEPDEFVGAVRTLLEDPEARRDLGRRGRQLVKDRYDWKVYVDWLKEYCGTLRSA